MSGESSVFYVWPPHEADGTVPATAEAITEEMVDRAAGLLHGHECGWKRAFGDLPWFHQKVHRDVAREVLEAVICS